MMIASRHADLPLDVFLLIRQDIREKARKHRYLFAKWLVNQPRRRPPVAAPAPVVAVVEAEPVRVVRHWRVEVRCFFRAHPTPACRDTIAAALGVTGDMPTLLLNTSLHCMAQSGMLVRVGRVAKDPGRKGKRLTLWAMKKG